MKKIIIIFLLLYSINSFSKNNLSNYCEINYSNIIINFHNEDIVSNNINTFQNNYSEIDLSNNLIIEDTIKFYIERFLKKNNENILFYQKKNKQNILRTYGKYNFKEYLFLILPGDQKPNLINFKLINNNNNIILKYENPKFLNCFNKSVYILKFPKISSGLLFSEIILFSEDNYKKDNNNKLLNKIFILNITCLLMCFMFVTFINIRTIIINISSNMSIFLTGIIFFTSLLLLLNIINTYYLNILISINSLFFVLFLSEIIKYLFYSRNQKNIKNLRINKFRCEYISILFVLLIPILNVFNYNFISEYISVCVFYLIFLSFLNSFINEDK